jgi:2-polyprenyl-3-methyl-5-hydroxy-6-metoxy-1,4-benzoquinol methylase
VLSEGADVRQSEDPEPTAIAAMVGSDRTVLDCGCGGGRIARSLVRCEVDGIELSEGAAREARSVCRQVVHGSITEPAAWGELGTRRYDAIVFSHVLEHLVDPFAALALARKHLIPGGRFIVVLPNVATWRTRWELLMGRWDYADEGILDRTHVKFYTLKTARELLVDAGLCVQKEQLFSMPPAGNAIRRLLVRGVRRVSPEATTHSFLFVAIPMRD